MGWSILIPEPFYKKVPDSINHLISTAKLLAARLERLSADSSWAHRASGLRGSLLREIESAQGFMKEELSDPAMYERLALLVTEGFLILENAARAITPPEEEK